jgi:hypothetical protein
MIHCLATITWKTKSNYNEHVDVDFPLEDITHKEQSISAE